MSEAENVTVSSGETPPAAADRGWCLCLSGGGFRATLFHLGVCSAQRTRRARPTVHHHQRVRRKHPQRRAGCPLVSASSSVRTVSTPIIDRGDRPTDSRVLLERFAYADPARDAPQSGELGSAVPGLVLRIGAISWPRATSRCYRCRLSDIPARPRRAPFYLLLDQCPHRGVLALSRRAAGANG